MGSRLDQLADSYVDDWAALDPLSATVLGIAGHDGETTDLSPDGYAARADLDRRTLTDLDSVVPENDRERVAVAAMRERLALAVELYDAGDATRELNVIASPLQGLRMVYDMMPAAEPEPIMHRLRGFPIALAEYQRTLTESATAGRAPALRQVLACAEQCEKWAGSEDFFGGLADQVAAAGGPAGVAGAAAKAREATAEFGRFLRGELAALAEPRDAVGPERYARASRAFLGAKVDLAEAYAWGWDELGRIEAEMSSVARQIGGENVDEAVALLDADRYRIITGKEAFRDWMQALADRVIDELDGKHFDIPEPIRRIECMIAPTTEGGIYYTGPSEDFSRPGRMWWAVPEGTTEFSTWREVTTVFHEGVPGHHLQVAQSAYRKDLLNRWQRTLCWVSGHGEGWALYAERLMGELGYLEDPGDRLGMLDMQAFRAARVIVDIGMHLELTVPPASPWRPGERWTPEMGWEFMRAHCRIDDAMLRRELDRYLGWPGQAPSYKLGERLWLTARAEAESRPGFDLRKFHRAALDLGSMGLDPLREALAAL